MTNPRDYPDEIRSAESGRPLRRGVKMLTITVDGQAFTYGQPGWWASLDDPADTEGQNGRRRQRGSCRRTAGGAGQSETFDPDPVGDPRNSGSLRPVATGRRAGVRRGAKAFEKYEAGEVAPSAAIAVACGEAAGVVSERLGRTDDGGGRCRYDPADGAGEFDRRNLR